MCLLWEFDLGTDGDAQAIPAYLGRSGAGGIRVRGRMGSHRQTPLAPDWVKPPASESGGGADGAVMIEGTGLVGTLADRSRHPSIRTLADDNPFALSASNR